MSNVKTIVVMQIKSAFAYLPAGCTYAAGITGFLLVLCAGWKFYLHKKIPRLFWWRFLAGFFYIVYMYCVLQLTIFSREPGNYGAVDWRFLVRWNENDAQKAFLLANIIMFIPFGVLLPMFCKTMSHILIVLPLAVICSISIEALQLKYQLGLCQLDDVVANSAGFLIGYLIFLMIRDVYLLVVMLFRLLAAILCRLQRMV